MKMKKIYSILLSVMAVASIQGCNLDRLPEDSITPQNYFSSENELQLWTNKFYRLLDGAEVLTGQNADDLIDNELGDLMMGQRSPFDEKGWNWDMLRSINYYLQNSHHCKDVVARNKYDGVALFFRAYFYFEKVRRYGDVPWYDQVLNSEDDELLFKPRDSREVVMGHVMEDLDKAIKLLPNAKSTERVTRWTALALKSRAALYEGIFRKYHGIEGADKYLREAVKAGRDLINGGGYEPYAVGNTPYADLFNDTSKERALGKEVILWKVHSNAANVTNGIQFNIINSRQSFTKRFMNHYLMADGSRFTDQADWDKLQFVAEVSNRDPRLSQTVLTPNYVQPGAKSPTVNLMNAHTGYQPVKFVAEDAYSGAGKGITNMPLFRAAEVYLNYAEAKAELGELTQEDLDISINKLRVRASMPKLQLNQANANPDPMLLSYYPNVTKGANTGVILEIRRERTVELVMEGFRQWDLLRWKEGATFAAPFEGVYFPGVGAYDMDGDDVADILIYDGDAGSFKGKKLKLNSDIRLSNGQSGLVVALPEQKVDWNEERDYLWPIPAGERVLTGGKLSQNRGWSDGLSF